MSNYKKSANLMLILAGIIMVIGIAYMLIQGSKVPKDFISAGDQTFILKSAVEHTYDVSSRQGTTRKKEYDVLFETEDGQYRYQELYKDGRAVLQTDIGRKQMVRTVFLYKKDGQQTYYVGSKEGMSVADARGELRKKAYQDAAMPLLVGFFVLLGSLVLHDFARKSEKSKASSIRK